MRFIRLIVGTEMEGYEGLWTAFAGGGDALVIVVERGARNRMCI